MLNKEELIAFEEDIANCFNNKMIRAPIHLYSGNEEEMIKIFKDNEIGPDDWILCSWRSHYQCLLKGVPKEQLKADILAGKSITLCYPEYNIFSSAIVTGNIPIAVGIALSLKRAKRRGRVFCFVGDMTSESGAFSENFKYSVNNNLPIKFIVEDNGKSVCTDTKKTWSTEMLSAEAISILDSEAINKYLYYYKYTSKWQHAGTNVRVQF